LVFIILALMKKIEVVAAIIKNNDHFLCCQRKKSKLTYLSEKWEFPGGKLEIGETREQALLREIDEELGMRICDIKFALTVVHVYEDFELTMHAFHVSTKQDKFKLHAHKKAIWATLGKLSDFNWAAADIPIVKHLQN
jgi:8-oxo-dGTP diphosphatase